MFLWQPPLIDGLMWFQLEEKNETFSVCKVTSSFPSGVFVSNMSLAPKLQLDFTFIDV